MAKRFYSRVTILTMFSFCKELFYQACLTKIQDYFMFTNMFHMNEYMYSKPSVFKDTIKTCHQLEASMKVICKNETIVHRCASYLSLKFAQNACY